MSRYRRPQDAGAEWLRAFPQARKKYFNQCVICQQIGYDPQKARTNLKIGFQNVIAKHFKPLEVNEIGVCAECAERMKASEASDEKTD
jgi:hypothetical protein